LAATLGGTQSLHTNSFDEAIGLPTEFSAKIARNTQLILQHETGITDTVDPLAGSYFVENLTKELIEKADELIEKIEDMGGMTVAVINGFPKSEIEISATKRQAKIDSGEQVIVGVNKFKSDQQDLIDVLDIDNKVVREEQITKLNQIKNTRNTVDVNNTLDNLKKAAENNTGNLLELSIEAVRARATVGEISFALEEVYGRYGVKQQVIKDVYKNTYSNKDDFVEVDSALTKFKKIAGENPKIFMAKLGQDGHDRGAKVIASAFTDIGFNVEIGTLFQTPAEAVEQAIQSNVHVIGVSSLAAGHKTLIPELIQELKNRHADDILVVCGGVIPSQDYQFLYDVGVSAIFGPGTSIPHAASTTINKASEQLMRMHNFRKARISK
jgi:methylmalonyl-CoA mutase